MNEHFKPNHRDDSSRVEAYPITVAEFEADGSGRVSVGDGPLIEVPAGFRPEAGAVEEGDYVRRVEGGPIHHMAKAEFEATHEAAEFPPPADAG